MKRLTLLYVSLLLFSFSRKPCFNSKSNLDQEGNRAIIRTINTPQNDSSSWVDNFRKLRNAIYHRDMVNVKTYIDFPIMNENNEIWELVYRGNENQLNRLPKTIKPFTEEDFEKYFDKLFSRRFINTILKIKTEVLFQKGQTETDGFNEGKATTYYMIATFDKSNEKLVLILSSKTVYKNDDDGESGIDYEFKILKDGRIKFLQVRLAG